MAYSHHDFEVIRSEPQFGGFEVLKLKDGSMPHTGFFRKSMINRSQPTFEEFSVVVDVMSLVCCVLQRSGTRYPNYNYRGRAWVLLSLPEEQFRELELAAQ